MNKHVLKICSKCRKLLAAELFNWKRKGIQRASACRECTRLQVQEHYRRNKQYYLQKARARNSLNRRRIYALMEEYLRNHPCVDCGETDIVVLEFDHRERIEKTSDVSYIIRRRRSWKTVMKEIEKCDVRCANCHRRKSERESKSWRTQLAPVA